MANPISVFLVDDHKLLRAGLISVLNSFPDLRVAGEASGPRELQDFLDANPMPDIVLMDVGLGDESGIDLTRHLAAHFPKVKVIGLTVSDEQSDIVELVQAGAKGYVLKNTDRSELYEAILKVAAGGAYFASRVAESLLERFLNTGLNGSAPDIPMRQTPNPDAHLTKREIDILVMVAKEHSTLQIAEKLNISPRTVENHRFRLTQKLGVKGAAGLAKYAIKHGFLPAA